MQDDLIEEHVFFKFADQVSSICHELFNRTPINYFCIGRAYDNGDYGALLSDKGWAYHYLKNDFQELGVEHQLAAQTPSHYFWNLTCIKPNCLKTQAFYQSCIQFKRGNGVIFVTEQANCKEMAMFTTPNDPFRNDPYIVENIAFLKRFILYFKDKLYSNKQLYNAYCTRYRNEVSKLNPVEILKPEPFDFEIRNYYLGGEFQDISFSKREAQCMKYIAIGKSSKEIARILSLSPRTIETHLDNIKRKTDSNSLYELLLKLEKCTLLDCLK